ncbi:MAG: hypothetical protein ACYS30_03630 [Planctomycetota bacterium]|jgi:hypothetical protein
MAKITIALLALTALVYAAFLVLFNRQLPDPKEFSGARRRFLLATLMFVGLMGPTSVMGRDPRVTCYLMVLLPRPNKLSHHELAAALKAIWRTLDPKQSEKFRKKLEAAAGKGTIRRKTADMLAIAFDEFAYHNQRTGGKVPKRPIKEPPFILCYVTPAKAVPIDSTSKTSERRRLKALKQLEVLQIARQSNIIDPETADKANAALARDMNIKVCKLRPKNRPLITCYDISSIHSEHITTKQYAKKALKQLEVLRKARQTGTIDPETAAKAHAVLERQIQMLYQTKNGDIASLFVAKEDKEEKTVVSDSASVAAAIIVEMEGGQVPGFTAARRLATMKERMEKLLKNGPVGNDWIDPAIRSNISAILEKTGLIERRQMVLCYKRSAVPIPPRSDELNKLQQQLLDKNVKVGVLDVEVAEKAAKAAARELKVDYATEKDIQNYQKKVRRAIRMLYKHGELPSSFVNELEKAIDIDIITFNQAKALRNDMRYYLSFIFWQPIGNEVLNILQKRKLIPPPRNHRHIMKYIGSKTQLSEQQKKQLADFKALIDGDAEFNLPEDEKVMIHKWLFLQNDTEYRLRMRRVCRVLVKTGLARNNQITKLEELIQIPIVGTLEAG